MNRFKNMLLAGTIIPALAVTPALNAFAQEGDPGTHPGHHSGGKSHKEHAGAADDAGGARGAGSASKASADKAPPASRENAHADSERSPASRKNAEGAPHSPGKSPAESADADRSAPADAGSPSKRSQRKAAKAAQDDVAPATKPETSAQTDDRGHTGDRMRKDRSKEARDSKPNASDTATTRDTKPGGVDTNTARDNRAAPDSATARDTKRGGAPDANTARDNRAVPDSTNARDTSRPTNRNDTRDASRPTDRNDARDTTRAPAATNNAATDARIRNGQNQTFDRNGGNRGMSPAGAAAVGAAAGFAGGFLAATGAQRLDDVRRDRREVVEDGRTYIREPGRTIVTDGDRRFVVHDENERFRDLGYNVRRERRGRDFADVIDRPGGVQIVTYTDADGRMLRRVRRDSSGREVILIDNGVNGSIRPYQDDIVDLPPPPMRLPRDRYVVDYRNANETLLYDTLTAPPLAAPPQRYTLDQIRYSPDVRNYVRSVDINTINFDTASWTVPGEATGKLQALAGAINRAVERNPNSVFLVEGYTDAVGNPTDNLSLSDRRAQSVAAILTKSFNVPPENLTTQGYGQQNLKVDTQGPSAENRRVVVRNITQLIASGNQPVPQE